MTTSGAVPRTADLRLAACVRSAKRSVPCRAEGEALGSLATKRPRSEHREWYGVPGLRMVAVCPRGCSRLRLTHVYIIPDQPVGMLNNRGGPAVVVGEGVVRVW